LIGLLFSIPMSSKAFKIAAVQMKCTADTARNMAVAEKCIRKAAKSGARIVCLPELFRSLYFCQSEDHANFELAEPVPGPTTDALADLARDLDIVIVASVFERRAAGVYHNSAVVLDAGGSLAGLYRKMHIPDDPLYYEKFYFTPGDLGFQAIDTVCGRVGTLVCWDQWYPEAARLTALQGAVVLVYPTAIGWHPSEKRKWGASQLSAWQTMQRSHAIANGVYVAAVNRTGHEGPRRGGIEFWGSSFICDPYGKVIAEARKDREEIIMAECDPSVLETARQHWPFLRDRRIDAYSPILERTLEKP
jgi:N-carbamoylputrescine amidase